MNLHLPNELANVRFYDKYSHLCGSKKSIMNISNKNLPNLISKIESFSKLE